MFVLLHLLCQLFSVTFFMASGFLASREYSSKQATGKSEADHAKHPRGLQVRALHNKAYCEKGRHQYGGGEQSRIYDSAGFCPTQSSSRKYGREKAEGRAHVTHGSLPQAYLGQDEACYTQQYKGGYGPGRQCREYGPGFPGFHFYIGQQKNTPVK